MPCSAFPQKVLLRSSHQKEAVNSGRNLPQTKNSTSSSDRKSYRRYFSYDVMKYCLGLLSHVRDPKISGSHRSAWGMQTSVMQRQQL